jgi:phage terminase large subunit-like protein/intein/homing endonuclease
MIEFEEYFTGILDNKIVACDAMKKISEILMEDYTNPKEFHYDHSIASKHVDFIEKFCKQPSGKIGEPLKLELFQKARLQATFGMVDDNNIRQYNEVLIIEGRKNGKALSLDTPIITPTGWKTMKELKVGDYVYGNDGKPTKITLASEVFKDHDCYEITFEDGEKITADADHIWTVMTKNSRRASKRKIKYESKSEIKYRENDGYFDITTKEMIRDFVHIRNDGKGKEYKYRVPMNGAIEFNEQNLLIDPYVLGVWLGDGDSRGPRITMSPDDVEMIEHLKNTGIVVKISEDKRNGVLRPTLINKKHLTHCRRGHLKTKHMDSNKKCRVCENELRRLKRNKKEIPEWNPLYLTIVEQLRLLGVLNNKHIPINYLMSSIEQRMELLRGLMDTDGYVEKRGQCEFVQKRKKLINDFSELLSSLGIKHTIREKQARCNGRDAGTVYSVLFYVDKNSSCFKMERKHNRLKDSLAPRMKNKSIVDIRKVESVPTKCIAVDNDEHLYLAGKRMTVTHNTTETAAVELDLLVNDNEGSPQIYNVATMLDQAKLGFNAAHKMVQQSPMLRKHIKKRANDLYFALNFGFIKALASNANSLDGLDVHGATIDELAAIKNRDIYDLVKQAMGARRQPLLFTITTNGFVRDGIFDSQYEYAKNLLYGKLNEKNRRFLPFIYELDDRDEWDKEEMWIKANPGIDTIKSRDYLRQMVEKAKDDPSFKPTVMVKDFNLKENSASAWLTWDHIENKTSFDFKKMKFRYGIGGFDAADTTDLNAAKAICMRPNDDKIYVKSMYWLPEEVLNKMTQDGNRRERDNVPYLLWERQGLLRTYPGDKVDKRVFLDWFKELRTEEDLYITQIGYDPWRIDDSLLREFKLEFGPNSMIPIRQGAATMSNPLKELKADLKANRIVHNSNPIDMWNLANAEIKSDTNNNIQLVKSDDPRKRIDGTVALACAYIVLKDNYDDYVNII